MKNFYKPINLERCLKKGIVAASVIGAAFVSGNLNAQAPSYCASSPYNSYGMDIFNVSFATLNNSSNCTSVAGPGSTMGTFNGQGAQYSNYTAPFLAATSVVTGVNYSLSVTMGDCFSGNSGSGWLSVWIDYNANGSFYDPGELVYQSSQQLSYVSAGTTIALFGGITIPTNATAGTTRMRVIANSDYYAADPCTSGNFNYDEGETEDYTINIIAAQACFNTPAASAVVAPTGSLCAGTQVFLSTTPANLFANVTYTWEAATSSSVGPYTAIATATEAVLITSFSTDTWVRLVSQCPNNGSTITATPAEILIAATTVSNVPYIEGFEEPSVQNGMAPNCSWNVSTPGFCQFGPSAEFGNITPNNGNGLAFWGANIFTFGQPVSTYWFYTNGIQLNAGVTYSGSIFWQGCGYDPMSLTFGTAQTPAAQTNTIVSNANPCNFGTWKNMSNTFTVATSGVYYVAISGSTAYQDDWMAFDDLSITVPCQFTVNQANTTLNAPAAICLGKSGILSASGANSYTWSSNSSTVLTTGSSITVTPTNGTSYTVTGTKSLSGCNSNQVTYINVNPTPGMQILPSVSAICLGQTATLIALGGGGTVLSYTWSTTDTGPTAFTTTVSPSSTTTYSLLGINSFGCVGTATQVITVNQPPVISVQGSQNICIGEPGTMVASGPNVNAFTWASASAYLVANPISPYPVANQTYTITGTDINGCPGSTTFNLIVSACTGIKTNSSALSNLQVYPNPNSGVFTVELNNGLTKSIEVMDVTGRVIVSNTSENDQVNVNISNLSNGIYYVKVKSDNAVEVLKVVKQ